MGWQEYRNNDRLEQEQLEICRALIEDATPDTVLWLQANPSAEERDLVLAIQGLLAELARIVERRMDRRKEVKDDWAWSETVGEVLSRLEKAGELRGNIVGKGLVRLPKLLPRELLGAKARSATQSTGIIPGQFLGSRPEECTRPLLGRKSTEVPANPPTYFPGDLWPQTNVVLLESRRKFPQRTYTLELCRHIVSEMTPLFCDAVKTGKMKADAVQRENGGGMEDLLHSLLVYNDDGISTGIGLSNEAFRLGKKVRQSDEWLALAKAVEKARLEAQQNNVTAPPRTDENSATSRQSVDQKPERGNPEVAKRGVLVRSNQGESAEELCQIFDMESVSLPRKWLDAGLQTWTKAYKNSLYRERIHTLISKGRRKN